MTSPASPASSPGGAPRGSEGVAWLRPTSGRVTGWFGLVAGVAVGVAMVVDDQQWSYAVPAFLLAALAWSAMLRPRVGTTPADLVLRGMVSTTRLPLVRARDLVVRQVLAVTVDDKRYTNPAIGHAHRTLAKRRRVPDGQRAMFGGDPHEVGYADHLEQLLREKVREAVRDQAHLGLDPDAPVRRSWAWPEVAALAVLLVALVAVLAL